MSSLQDLDSIVMPEEMLESVIIHLDLLIAVNMFVKVFKKDVEEKVTMNKNQKKDLKKYATL